MACAALKRPHNFDLLANNCPEELACSANKRRCGATASFVSPSATISPFEATPKVSRCELTKCVHDEWKRLHRRRKLLSPSSPHGTQNALHMTCSSTHPSSYWNTNVTSPSSGMSPPSGLSFSPGSPSGSISPPRGKEHASLTIKQVVLLCERLWKEREEKLREEYDQILHEKLGEQYDSFLKFTQDQIIRKYQESSCSYVS